MSMCIQQPGDHNHSIDWGAALLTKEPDPYFERDE